MPRRLILVTAAIVLWNTVYLERVANALHGHGQQSMTSCCNTCHRWAGGHINLTGDYLWRSNAKIGAGKFRPLRPYILCTWVNGCVCSLTNWVVAGV